ncbi:MAG TPA: cupin domain-containing protein [Meiothermus sp.]|jgi:mannose-6-phosphate isomerase-like protein (cupin superfamily)|nr:cupin domain-containing protein [Meiothermus sp.]
MISKAEAEHYTWGQNCDGWHLVRRPELGVIQERMPPGTSEVRHHHRQARQFFFVLAGRANFELNGEELELGPGEGIEVEPGIPHRIANHGQEDLEFLVVSQPHAHRDRVVL